ncbi:MAG: hypothetical protein JWP14_3400 [Frankiales bacterium]|nr:hypothetical protein [Frankiales bacterium]
MRMLPSVFFVAGALLVRLAVWQLRKGDDALGALLLTFGGVLLADSAVR